MRTIRRLAVLMLTGLVLGIAAPAAIARPIDDPALPAPAAYSAGCPWRGHSTVQVACSVPSTPVTYSAAPASTGSSFDWGDAGIGALAAFAVSTIGVGSVLLLKQRRTGERRKTVAA